MSDETKRALIVDDSRSACVVLSRMLSRYGIISSYVHSAVDAFEYLESRHPDIIFMDHSMPDMDGLQAVDQIKQQDSLRNIPIMMFTARSDDEYIVQAREAGALDVIPKVLDSEGVKDTLEKAGIIGSQVVSTTVKHDDEPTEEEKMRVWLESVIENKIAPALTFRIDDATRELREETVQQAQRMYRDSLRFHLRQHKELTRNVKAQSDYLLSAYHQNKQQLLRRMSLLLLLTFSVGIGFVWQMYDTSNKWANQWAERSDIQQEWQQKLYEQQEEKVALASVRTTNSVASPQQKTSISINDSNGQAIGKLIDMDASGRWLSVQSFSNYLFQIDNQGSVREFAGDRYFTTADCFGEPWIEAHKGLIFSDQQQRLWFTPHDETPVTIRAFSMLDNKGECKELSSEDRALVRLVPNNQNITGLDANQFEVNASSFSQTY